MADAIQRLGIVLGMKATPIAMTAEAVMITTREAVGVEREV